LEIDFTCPYCQKKIRGFDLNANTINVKGSVPCGGDVQCSFTCPMCDNETELIVYGSKSLGEQMVKWQYRVHGYIYNPEDGDMDHGVNPGTLLRINLTIGGVLPAVQAKTRIRN
jgi:rubredoxin